MRRIIENGSIVEYFKFFEKNYYVKWFDEIFMLLRKR